MRSTTLKPSHEERPLRLALVLWSGYIGGAETFTADLAAAMRGRGVDARLVFVLHAADLREHLHRKRVPYSELGLKRGREVIQHRHRFAQIVADIDPDAAILSSSGYLARALKTGGFDGHIIAVEHGSLLQIPTLGVLRRLLYRLDRAAGVKACSAVVPVSQYLAERLDLRRFRKHARIVCIPNGVDVRRFSPIAADTGRDDAGRFIIGTAGRLIDGKGFEDAIAALTERPLHHAQLRIAGDGPRLETLRTLAASKGVDRRVFFLGTVKDMPSFWRDVDVAVMPSHGWVESFGMSAVEAMACGKPVVASDSGALPEVVVDGTTGRVVRAGDSAKLAEALAAYASDPANSRRHGREARRLAVDEYSIERAAERYLQLCFELIGRGQVT